MFNIIVLPPDATSSKTTYQYYNCYMRAAFQGMNQSNCSIPAIQTNGNCTTCVTSATTAKTATACLGCNISFVTPILQ